MDKEYETKAIIIMRLAGNTLTQRGGCVGLNIGKNRR